MINNFIELSFKQIYLFLTTEVGQDGVHQSEVGVVMDGEVKDGVGLVREGDLLVVNQLGVGLVVEAYVEQAEVDQGGFGLL